MINDISHWREVLEISVGMSKEQALEKFAEWRSTKKTCQRCEGEKLTDYCQLKLICMEVDYVNGNASGNDNRRRTSKAFESKTVRTPVSTDRVRTPLR